jgi:hypothetical protein
MTDKIPVFTAPDIVFPWCVALNRKHEKHVSSFQCIFVHVKLQLFIYYVFGFILSMQTRF